MFRLTAKIVELFEEGKGSRRSADKELAPVNELPLAPTLCGLDDRLHGPDELVQPLIAVIFLDSPNESVETPLGVPGTDWGDRGW